MCIRDSAAYVTVADGPVDLSAYQGLSFYAKGIGIDKMNIQITTTEQMAICEPNRYYTSVTLQGDWNLYTIPWSTFVADDWGLNMPPFDPAQIEWFYFNVEELSGIQTNGEFSLDDIAAF